MHFQKYQMNLFHWCWYCLSKIHQHYYISIQMWCIWNNMGNNGLLSSRGCTVAHLRGSGKKIMY